jgi:DNA polymerase
VNVGDKGESKVDSEIIKKAKLAAGRIDIFYGAPLSAMADCLRGFCIPANGKVFVGGDFSNIEGRVLAWLAGEEWKLEAFRQFDLGVGADIYILGYSKSFKTPLDQVDDNKRQIGKVQELSLGFGGGKGAFQNMAKNYGVKVSDQVADEIKNAWRAANPAIVQYWYALERAAMNAILNHGKIYTAGAKGREVKYLVKGSFLWCQLPSGRPLCYPYPKIQEVMKPWGELGEAVTYMYVDSLTNTWMRGSTYGGSFCENNTQGVARDVFTEAMLRVEDAGYPISLHNHDEINAEISDFSLSRVSEFKQLMAQNPTWAVNLPIAVVAYQKSRYGK